MPFDFVKGSEVKIRVNGAILGGVHSAEIADKSTVKKIEEYLSDIPVAEQKNTVYKIKLTLESGSLAPLEDVELESVQISRGNTSVSFEECSPESISVKIPSDGAALHTVTIEARRRSVENE